MDYSAEESLEVMDLANSRNVVSGVLIKGIERQELIVWPDIQGNIHNSLSMIDY